jgi:AcrR family transcriptional regulator
MVDQKKAAPKLGREDWVKTGLVVLANSGVEAVRVEPLAKLMNVTKGSFYWHFKDRNALLDAILEEWVRLDTSSVIDRINQLDADPRVRLLQLFEIAVGDGGEVEGLADGRIENAIRAWATRDPRVAAVVAQVDEQRLKYTQDLFLQIGFTPFEALVRARMAYYTLVVAEFAIDARRSQEERLLEARLQYDILTRKLS